MTALMETLHKDVLQELTCPVCKDYMIPPIKLCETGHSVCQDCRNKLQKCPLCKKAFTNGKNFCLEALSAKVVYPCVNKSWGCDLKLMLEEKKSHEEDCAFMGFKCAIEGCSWSGLRKDLLQHWNKVEIFKQRIEQFVSISKIRIDVDSFYINLIQRHDEHFWFKCKLRKGKISWAIQFLGHPDKAKNFFYGIEIIKQGALHQGIILKDYCQGVNIENNDLFKDGYCSSASIDCIKHFAGDNKYLSCSVYIKKSNYTETVKIVQENNQCSDAKTNQNTKITRHKINALEVIFMIILYSAGVFFYIRPMSV